MIAICCRFGRLAWARSLGSACLLKCLRINPMNSGSLTAPVDIRLILCSQRNCLVGGSWIWTSVRTSVTGNINLCCVFASGAVRRRGLSLSKEMNEGARVASVTQYGTAACQDPQVRVLISSGSGQVGTCVHTSKPNLCFTVLLMVATSLSFREATMMLVFSAPLKGNIRQTQFGLVLLAKE